MPSYDLAIIGAGPGGFEAALRAKELGFKVALIEKADAGGTCLNTGCIPTKALLASTKLLTKIRNAASYGLSVSEISADLNAMVNRKNRIVETLKKGMTETLKKSGVEWIVGTAAFLSKNRLRVTNKNETQEIDSQSILIATGAGPMPLKGAPFDGKGILSSTDILELRNVPKRLLIIGGSVIGVEFASIFEPLGVKVTIVEMLERLLFNEDEEVSRRLESIFRRKGIETHTGEKVQALTVQNNAVQAILESGLKLEADLALIAIGRRPYLESLGLENAGIKIEKGAIAVNEFLETSAPGIYAIGDVTTRSTGLAHGASAEGVRVVENLKGSKKKMDYGTIPYCIYSDPEVASVGNARAVRRNTVEETVECKVLFSSLGKSQIEGETEGFLKMIASKRDGRILGVSAIGAHVTELIHEGALAIQAGLSVKTLAETIHAHPTESEIYQKAVQKLRLLL
ncbi:MAG: dihydrolipoyl dehydrogenase [Candidatus Omnitrophica bacterium]|nr:dihydrolipoyl dehydrogenase [Candidatus Omnitrophota bacterium]